MEYRGYTITCNGWAWIGVREGYDGPGDHTNMKTGGNLESLKAEIDEQIDEDEELERVESNQMSPEDEAKAHAYFWREQYAEDDRYEGRY